MESLDQAEVVEISDRSCYVDVAGAFVVCHAVVPRLLDHLSLEFETIKCSCYMSVIGNHARVVCIEIVL